MCRYVVLASLDSWKTITDIVSNAVTVAAIATGGAWAYWRFARERTRWPRALLELVVTHRALTGERTLLNVTVKLHNAGAGLMRLTGLTLYIYRVLPLRDVAQLATGELFPTGAVEAKWPCIEKATRTWEAGQGPEIEPQENDEFVHDFLISSAVETLFIYAHVENEKRAHGARKLGWQATTFYDIKGVAGERHADNVPTGGQMSEYEGRQQHPREEPELEQTDEGLQEQQEPRQAPELEREPAGQQEARPEPELEGGDDDQHQARPEQS